MDKDNILDFLINRGYIEQVTHLEELREVLKKEKITFYVGIDPTADSLHIGHFMVLMLSKWLQKAGHRPIILIGGGTASIGDPTDKNDMRKLLSKEELEHNVNGITTQVKRFLDTEGENGAIVVNNADWLRNLNYLDFMRDIAIHFNINDMLRMDTYRTRLEQGLTFFEFGYMPLQAYDFYLLNKKYNCVLQLGGNDQWSNVIAGVNLIKKKEQKDSYAFTIKLLTKKDGQKMGKTVGGAVWLDPNKLSPFEFYQYWRNVEDEMVEKLFNVLTFESDEKIKEYMSLENINDVKKILAFKITEVIHGTEEAEKAEETSKAMFESGNNIEAITKKKIGNEKRLIEVLVNVGFAASNGEAKKLIKGNAISINDEKISDINYIITKNNEKDGNIILKKGKNNFINLIIK